MWGVHRGFSPYARFLRFTSLGCAKEVNKKIVYVHFFVKRQRNEPKIAFVRGCRPLHIPALPQSLFAPEAGAKSIAIRRRTGVRGVAAVGVERVICRFAKMA